MDMRKYILFICLSLVFLSGCGDAHENAEARSIATLKDFEGEYDHGDLLSDADNAEDVMADINKKLGDYFTDEYAIGLKNKIRSSMRNDRDFERDPETFSFFLINSGDGFRFSQFKVSSMANWLSQDNDVVGTVIYAYEDVDNPGWDEEYSKHGKVTLMKESWWDWKVDEAE